jgi:FKBP-type peptidyl-prolyl cis-trans isomerase FkpA
MRHAAALAAFTLITSGASAQEPKTEDQKTLYAVGLTVARELKVFELTPSELEFVMKGLGDAVNHKKLAVEGSAYEGKIQQLAGARRKATGERQSAAGKAFLEKAAAEKGAVKTDSGLVYVTLKEGAGPSPAATDTVKVHYRGTFIDGVEFDSSYKRNQPSEFVLNQVIKGWTEGLQKMKVGGKVRLICPPDLAYRDQGMASIPPYSTLVFEVELLEVKGKS